MKKRCNILKLVLTIVVVLIVIIFCVCYIYRDFLFAKNQIFPKTGEAIHLSIRGPGERVLNTDNQFKVRKVQNFIEKTEKVEIVQNEPESDGPVKRGGKDCYGGVTIDGKSYAIDIKNYVLTTNGKTYEIKDEDFYVKMDNLIKKIGNQYKR